jgi:hypothetical protein
VNIGYNAGQYAGLFASAPVAIGYGAGRYGVGLTGPEVSSSFFTLGPVAIGPGAGNQNQQPTSVAVGPLAGFLSQGSSSVAIGQSAGETNQGEYCTSIGSLAGRTNQDNNTIVLNASGVELNTAQGTGTYVNPIRDVSSTAGLQALYYDNNTNEIVRYVP